MTYRPHTDEDEFEQTLLGTGQAHHVRDNDAPENPRPLTRLYIPDPEQRSGWREWYIRPSLNQRRAAQRRIGFRKP